MSTTTVKLSDLSGSMVFNEDTMKERLSSASYEAWKEVRYRPWNVFGYLHANGESPRP